MPADILDLFHEHGLNPVKKTAREWASPCPCCGGTDRCSVWPDAQDGRGYYWCRQCDVKGDGIQFLRDYADMSYADACKRVGVAPTANLKAPSLPPAQRAERFAAVSGGELGQLQGVNRPVWQARAAAFVAWGTEHLINTPAQMDWLAARGIDAAAVRRYRLGFNPGEKGKNAIIRPREIWGLPEETREDGKPKRLWLPRGIIIPQILPGPAGGADVVHRVRIRRTEADRQEFNAKCKYFVAPGSAMDMLWLPCTAQRDSGVVVVTESELDAILLHHIAGDLAHCVASMTSNIRNMSREVFHRFEAAACILVALDSDKPGADGWPRWEATFPRARRWPVPTGKDPGEAFSAGENLRLWLLAGIPAGLRMTMTSGAQPEASPQGGEGVPEERAEAGENAAEDGAEIPPDVLTLHALWRNLPITYIRFQDDYGNCVGFEWNYSRSKKYRDKMSAFFSIVNASLDIYEWLSRNPENQITAKNFLDVC